MKRTGKIEFYECKKVSNFWGLFIRAAGVSGFTLLAFTTTVIGSSDIHISRIADVYWFCLAIFSLLIGLLYANWHCKPVTKTIKREGEYVLKNK